MELTEEVIVEGVSTGPHVMGTEVVTEEAEGIFKEEKANKLKVADILGAIACKSSFKVLARELTHRALQAGDGISSTRAQSIVTDIIFQQREAVKEEI